jgi:alpha-mannosidase
MDSISHCFPQFRIDNAPSVVLETIKKAEDSNDIIIRMFEAYGGHARARLIRYMTYLIYLHSILTTIYYSSKVITKAIKCNILEDYMEDIPVNSLSTLDRTFSTNLRVLDDDVLELQQQEQERYLNEGLLVKIKPFELVTLKISF